MKFQAAEDDLSGALIRERGSAIIGVNSAHSPARQRFTIAHELGHFCLHEAVDFHMDEDFVRVDFRDKAVGGAGDADEIAANRFAAALLMPEKFLQRELPKRKRLDTTAVASLARQFQVSPQAMEIRLRELGFLPPVSIW